MVLRLADPIAFLIFFYIHGLIRKDTFKSYNDDYWAFITLQICDNSASLSLLNIIALSTWHRVTSTESRANFLGESSEHNTNTLWSSNKLLIWFIGVCHCSYVCLLLAKYIFCFITFLWLKKLHLLSYIWLPSNISIMKHYHRYWWNSGMKGEKIEIRFWYAKCTHVVMPATEKPMIWWVCESITNRKLAEIWVMPSEDGWSRAFLQE